MKMTGPIDMQKQARLDRLVKETLSTLQGNDAQRFMPAFFGKSIVMLASRYLALNDVDGAMKLLVLNPPEFYRDSLPTLMAADSTFRDLAVHVANGVVEAQVVEQEHHHVPFWEVSRVQGEA